MSDVRITLGRLIGRYSIIYLTLKWNNGGLITVDYVRIKVGSIKREK